MFKKLNFNFSDDIVKKCVYLSKSIYNQPQELYGDPSGDGYLAKTEDDKLVIDYYSQNKFSTFVHYKFQYPPLLKQLPSNLLQYETPIINWQVIEGGSMLPGHVDLERKCAINFYIKSNNEQTIFYSRNRSGVFLSEKNNKYISNELFIPEWLTQIGSFVANNYDAYLIDTTIPHSVNTMNILEKRIAIAFSFYTLNYEKISQLIE